MPKKKTTQKKVKTQSKTTKAKKTLAKTKPKSGGKAKLTKPKAGKSKAKAASTRKSQTRPQAQPKPASKTRAQSRPSSSPKTSVSKPKNNQAESNKSSTNKSSSSGVLALGQEVPNFQLASTQGDFRLSDFRGKKVLLYFYPKDKTPGCTIEGHEFSQLLPEFQKLNTWVFGVSRDSIESHQDFKDCESYSVDLISDPEEVACKIFDVIREKNMYGKMVLGLVRSTFLIDEDGKLLQEWRSVKAEGHAKHVLDTLKSFS